MNISGRILHNNEYYPLIVSIQDYEDCLLINFENSLNDEIDKIELCIDKLDAEILYSPRFDWSKDKIFFKSTESDSLSVQQWFSPPPLAYGIKIQNGWYSLGLAIDENNYNFLSFNYYYENDKSYFSIDYEKHFGSSKLPNFIITKKIFLTENESIKDYVDCLVNHKYIQFNKKQVFDWWKKPIYCGWGDQRYIYRLLHNGSEHGDFINATNACSQILYERCLDKLLEKDIPFGTFIIDMGWALKEGNAIVNHFLWYDMKGFIKKLHELGKKVILWYGPFLKEGVSDELCIKVNDIATACDPTNPKFIKYQQNQIEYMLSSKGLDADGFKIDFTQECPSENGDFRQIFSSKYAISDIFVNPTSKYRYEPLNLSSRKKAVLYNNNVWGIELVKTMLNNIYKFMKTIKKDSLLITHTANPYFANCVDMLRLNDMDGTSNDVLNIMTNRAEIAKLCCPYWLIDSDNDLMIDKNMWREYTKIQLNLGIPDTYYILGIAQTMEEFKENDYKHIKNVFNEYLENIKDN